MPRQTIYRYIGPFRGVGAVLRDETFPATGAKLQLPATAGRQTLRSVSLKTVFGGMPLGRWPSNTQKAAKG